MNMARQRSPLILGLMRMNEVTAEELEDVLRFAIDNGIRYVDVADVYSRGRAESVLGEVFRRNPGMRERLFLQTKVGIVKKEGHPCYYDFSYRHIVEGTKESLRRLGLEYVDSLLLHRPDIFMDSKEVGRAIQVLKEEGFVRHFGVSNMDIQQMEYLAEESPLPIEVDQLQLGLGQCSLLANAFNVNNPSQIPLGYDGLFFYLKRKHIFLQCWSPYQVGLFEGSLFTHPKMKDTQQCLTELAKKYGTSPCAIATAFLTNLSDNVEVITGAIRKDYIQQSLDGTKIQLEKEDWYRLYQTTGNRLP